MIKHIATFILAASAAFSVFAIPKAPDNLSQEYKVLGTTQDEIWYWRKPGMPNSSGQFYVDIRVRYRPGTMLASDEKTEISHTDLRLLTTCNPISVKVESDKHFDKGAGHIKSDDDTLKQYVEKNPVMPGTSLGQAVAVICKIKNSVI